MLRLLDGILYESKPSDEWTLRVHELGNGHAEAVIRREEIWEEVRRATPDELECWERNRAESEEHREEANKKRAARRAKSRVRQLIKVLGLDALLTLTYRSNQTDMDMCKRHLKEFIRRMRKLIPGFKYVAAFEQQKRGAWHVHIAVHKLPVMLLASGVKVKSYNVVRAVWRAVVGDLGGNIDQQRRRRFAKHSAAKLAGYLSKYMMKAFEDGDDWKNRYSASAGVQIPEAVRLRFVGAALRDLIDLAYSVIGQGKCECRPWFSPWGDTFFLSTEVLAGLGSP